MLSDEQILEQVTNLLENVGKANKKPESLLREITEDELTHIERAIEEMGPEDLAFNEIFNGRKRIVIDFPTIDQTTDLGKFIDQYRKMGYNVDWEKGTISGEQTLAMTSPDDIALRAIGGQNHSGAKKRKIQMKIGKFWGKVADLHAKRKVYTDKIIAQAKLDDPDINIRHDGQLTGRQVADALGAEEQKRYYQIDSQIDMYIPNPGHFPADMVAYAKEMQKYWQLKADWIKKNLSLATNDRYSIIITRDPVDVLRMSDFEGISSCHSPPSRSGANGEYYKCAVAEAHGHGAVAYVVPTEDLLHLTNTGNIDSAEQEIQTGEIFADDVRGLGELQPQARLRLRQLRYYNEESKEIYRNKRIADMSDEEIEDYRAGKLERLPEKTDGVEIALPESRIYGAKIPGFRERIDAWTHEAQKEQISNMPRTEEGAINLSSFIKFGGSYEDNFTKSLVSRWLGGADVVGRIVQNTETEDNLDRNLVAGLEEQWEIECEEIASLANRRMVNCQVDYEVEDDGGGGLYIDVSAGMSLSWDTDEWSSLPNPIEGSHAAQELNDYGFGWIDSSGASIHRRGDKIIFVCNILLEGLPSGGAQAYAYDPWGFDELCSAVDTDADDKSDGVKVLLTQYFKREGYIAGGELYKLGTEIDNGDLTAYEWDLDTQESYDGDYEEVDATLKIWIDPEELGITDVPQETVVKILNSHDYNIAVRSMIHEEGTKSEYFVSAETGATVANAPGAEFAITHRIYVSEGDPAGQVEAFTDIIENADDEDVLADIFKTALKRLLSKALAANQSTPVNENQRIVSTWKDFLRG